MNDLIVDVKLWGESVGSLYWEKESNAALFDYERKFIRSGLDISPIIMPIDQYRNTPYRFLENRTDCFKGLPGLFADSLPDTVGSASSALPHFCGRFPNACPQTVLTCLHVHGSPLHLNLVALYLR